MSQKEAIKLKESDFFMLRLSDGRKEVYGFRENTSGKHYFPKELPYGKFLLDGTHYIGEKYPDTKDPIYTFLGVVPTPPRNVKKRATCTANYSYADNPDRTIWEPIPPSPQESEKIKEIVEARHIQFLVHFTRIENLRNIILQGIVSIELQEKQGICSTHNDPNRLDNRLAYSSLSVSFPNYKLFTKFRTGGAVPEEHWVVLKMEKEILFSDSNSCLFFSSNAAGFGYDSPSDHKGIGSFQKMFSDKITKKDGKAVVRGQNNSEFP